MDQNPKAKSNQDNTATERCRQAFCLYFYRDFWIELLPLKAIKVLTLIRAILYDY